MFDQMVQNVIRAVDRAQIPSGQYQAVLIDEGHDFEPAWLKLAAQMVDPNTNSLLLLYDDAQRIYQRRRAQQFSFKSVGIQAQGRTTILKINYRNTRQILQTASMVAADLLKPEECGEDGVPLVQPLSCGRDGQAPLIIRLPSLREETVRIAELLSAAHLEGHAWGDMAVLCRHYAGMDRCAAVLRQRGLPHQARRTGWDRCPKRVRTTWRRGDCSTWPRPERPSACSFPSAVRGVSRPVCRSARVRWSCEGVAGSSVGPSEEHGPGPPNCRRLCRGRTAGPTGPCESGVPAIRQSTLATRERGDPSRCPTRWA